jgi:hypothetical protein
MRPLSAQSEEKRGLIASFGTSAEFPVLHALPAVPAWVIVTGNRISTPAVAISGLKMGSRCESDTVPPL